MPFHDDCYEIAIQKFDEALKFTGTAYGRPCSDVVEGLRKSVQGLLQERQMNCYIFAEGEFLQQRAQ